MIWLGNTTMLGVKFEEDNYGSNIWMDRCIEQHQNAINSSQCHQNNPDNIIIKEVIKEVPVQKIVEVEKPVEKIVYREVEKPVIVEKVVYREIDKPIIVTNEIVKEVDKPIIVTNEIVKEIPTQTIYEYETNNYNTYNNITVQDPPIIGKIIDGVKMTNNTEILYAIAEILQGNDIEKSSDLNKHR